MQKNQFSCNSKCFPKISETGVPETQKVLNRIDFCHFRYLQVANLILI